MQVDHYKLYSDNVLECVTVDINFEKQKHASMTCVYRAPGHNISTFCDNIVPIIDDGHRNGKKFVCGDFNINILQHESDDSVRQFLDSMYALGLYPLITKPTRITRTTATIIDNIFTNDIELKYVCGLIIDDSSDHLPIFARCKGTINDEMKHKKVQMRQTKEANIKLLIQELANLSWDNVLLEEDTNMAYEKFMVECMRSFIKCCPLRDIGKKRNEISKKPWLSRGLINAFHKKNFLYRQFLKHRTITTENRYKTYKNKLTAILRKETNKYYCLLLQKNKKNIAGTWKILRTIMGNAHKTHDFPAKLNNSGNMINDQTDSATNIKFNGFFTNVGPALAKNITAPDDSSIFDYMQNRNENCIFLTPVDEIEVSRVVESCKIKLSTDSNGLSMYIVKRIIATIVTPITHNIIYIYIYM